jgi:hypothetical protein
VKMMIGWKKGKTVGSRWRKFGPLVQLKRVRPLSSIRTVRRGVIGMGNIYRCLCVNHEWYMYALFSQCRRESESDSVENLLISNSGMSQYLQFSCSLICLQVVCLQRVRSSSCDEIGYES